MRNTWKGIAKINDNVDDDISNNIVKEKEFSADIQSTINGGDVSTIIATVPFRNNESFLLINSDWAYIISIIND